MTKLEFFNEYLAPIFPKETQVLRVINPIKFNPDTMNLIFLVDQSPDEFLEKGKKRDVFENRIFFKLSLDRLEECIITLTSEGLNPGQPELLWNIVFNPSQDEKDIPITRSTTAMLYERFWRSVNLELLYWLLRHKNMTSMKVEEITFEDKKYKRVIAWDGELSQQYPKTTKLMTRMIFDHFGGTYNVDAIQYFAKIFANASNYLTMANSCVGQKQVDQKFIWKAVEKEMAPVEQFASFFVE